MRSHGVVNFARQSDVLDRSFFVLSITQYDDSEPLLRYRVEHICKSVAISAMADFAQPVVTADAPADEPTVVTKAQRQICQPAVLP